MHVPDAAASVFGAERDRAVQYAELLCTRGVEWGLLGPREPDRIWSRHILNSAAVAELVPERASVVDVGSGAGLPGIPLALCRPDLHVTLLEPLLRRVNFLRGVVDELGLGERVTVLRGRASTDDDRDPMVHHGVYDVVTSRAVAALPRLLAWCAPLVAPGGRVVALKGATAQTELSESADEVRRRGFSGRVAQLGAVGADADTWAVVLEAAPATQ